MFYAFYTFFNFIVTLSVCMSCPGGPIPHELFFLNFLSHDLKRTKCQENRLKFPDPLSLVEGRGLGTRLPHPRRGAGSGNETT